MREIVKSREPRELEEYRRKPDAFYDGSQFTPVKNAIREQLLLEQGYLCAYCMRRIKSDFGQMKVEHWHCQDNYKSEQLDYKNMLGVCIGNEGSALENQTCDTRKGNDDLKYNPANASHRIESQIYFLSDSGIIESDDDEFNAQLNNVLHLNHTRLKNNRKGVWDEVHQELSKRFSKKPGTRTSVEKATEIEKLLGEWNSKDGQGFLREYCAVAIYYLKKVKKKFDK